MTKREELDGGWRETERGREVVREEGMKGAGKGGKDGVILSFSSFPFLS